ncbi:MAG TPA: hypothetical protein VFS44_02575 [Gemmatimonadaceae bacterium]|nr:hypothetical protein [Gemmatimonadaceae bacterium]
MADESGAASAVKDAKGVVEEFVGVLVLLDIVLGGLALYWVRLAFPDVGAQLPGTGYDVVDVALLACAAAIVGKMVSLVASAVGAVVLMRAAATHDGPFAAVSRALIDYRTAAEGSSANTAELEAWGKDASWRAHWKELLGDAVAHLSNASPDAAARLERERASAALTYGVSVLVALFGAQLALRTRPWVGAVALAAVLLLLYSGRVRQRGYLRQLAAELEGAATAIAARRQGDGAGDTRAPKPVTGGGV